MSFTIDLLGPHRRAAFRVATMSVLAGAVAVGIACSNSSSGGPAQTCAKPGGPIMAAADMHCMDPEAGPIVQPTDPASCHPDAAVPDAGAMTCAYGDTLNNAEGDDDDCKYHVKWTSTPICVNNDVTFTVTATHKTDGTPLTGSNPVIEAFVGMMPCGSTHPAPNSNPSTKEGPPGTYSIGPIHFDVAGQWAVRFHFNEDCEDLLPTSPHGHAAFFVQVP
jgi:hypothetical protein